VAALTPSAATGAVLRHARIHVLMTTPTTCDVEAAFTVDVDAPAEVEHRIQVFEGTQVELIEAVGAAQQAGPPAIAGRTQSLTMRFSGTGTGTYTLRYRIRQLDAWAYRCPMWLPTVPADGRSRAVELEVDIPPRASAAGGGLPALKWAAGRGTATLGHVPAFVRVPYTMAGEATDARAGWDVAHLMDVLAIAALVGGSAVWAWRRRRR